MSTNVYKMFVDAGIITGVGNTIRDDGTPLWTAIDIAYEQEHEFAEFLCPIAFSALMWQGNREVMRCQARTDDLDSLDIPRVLREQLQDLPSVLGMNLLKVLPVFFVPVFRMLLQFSLNSDGPPIPMYWITPSRKKRLEPQLHWLQEEVIHFDNGLPKHVQSIKWSYPIHLVDMPSFIIGAGYNPLKLEHELTDDRGLITLMPLCEKMMELIQGLETKHHVLDVYKR